LVGKFDRQQLQNVGLCLALLAAFAIVGAIFGMVIRTRTPMKESNRRLLHEQKDLTLRMLQTEEQILDPNTDQATVAYLQAKLTAASYALDKIAAQVPQSGQGVFAEMVTSNAASLLARPVHESLLKNKSRPLANTINDGTTEILRNVSRSLDISGETEPGSGGNSSV